MKFFLILSAVLAAAAALPTRSAPDIVSENNMLMQGNGSIYNMARNDRLMGFGRNTQGGAGGAVWTVWDCWALRDALNSAERRIVYVRGRIDCTPLFTGSPGVVLHVGPYKSIYGGDGNAMIFGAGLRMTNQVHIIIQNIKFHNAISYAPGEQPNGHGGIISQVAGAFGAIDSIDIDHSENIWVDACEFADDPWNGRVPISHTAENQRRHNGLLTIKRGASHISISNNLFRNHDMAFLIGHDDSNQWQDNGRLYVSIYFNWFQGTGQRNPMVRFGLVHVLNNLYTDMRSYGIGVYTGARIYSERNHFINTARAWAHPLWNAPAANIHYYNLNNLLTNSAFDSGMTGGNIGWQPSQHYGYVPIAVNTVEAHVRRWAGPFL